MPRAYLAGQPAIAHEGRYLQQVKEEIVDYLRRLNLEAVGLIGHSLGGFLSLQLAAENPERFSAVVVIDAAPFLPALQVPGITAEGAKSMAANMWQRLLNQKADDREVNQRGALHSMVSGKEDLERILSWNMASDLETVAQAMYELYSTDYRQEIASIKVPVLVMGAWIAYKDYGVTKEAVFRLIKANTPN
jgi:N-formylmaleamate deformylase